MEEITIKAEFLFELQSKNDWVNKVPRILPKQTRAGENLIWIDKNGCVFELGKDFMDAEKLNTYPCKVYRPYSVSSFNKGDIKPQQSNYPYRVGKKQGRAVLNAQGEQEVLFPVGKEKEAQEYCDWINTDPQLSIKEIEVQALEFAKRCDPLNQTLEKQADLRMGFLYGIKYLAEKLKIKII